MPSDRIGALPTKLTFAVACKRILYFGNDGILKGESKKTEKKNENFIFYSKVDIKKRSLDKETYETPDHLSSLNFDLVK